MKPIIPIILLLFACSNMSQIDKQEKVMDSLDNVLTVDSLRMQIMIEVSRVMNTKDSSIMKKNGELDTLLKYVDLYKDDSDELKKIKQRIADIHNSNTAAIDSVKQLMVENKLVKSELTKTKQMYAITSAEVVKAKKEVDKIKRELTHPTIAGVRINTDTFKLAFLRAAKQIETNVAKDVKRIELFFIIPENNLIEKDTYVINIKIGTILKKSVFVKLTGEEFRTDPLIKFDIVDLLKAGEYPVNIDIDGKQEYSGNLTLQ